MTDSKCVCIRFALDASKVVRVDGPVQTDYSGSYTLDGVEHEAYGEAGGSWNWSDDVIKSIREACEAEWGEAPDTDVILDAVERTEDAVIAVHRVGTTFQVAVEDVF